MSVAIGASATGARAYTATASQGLLYMTEALYNASGLGLPIVMTVANRAIGAPINIWNDHSDSMSQRDSGWIQLYAETNQEALDLHVQAFRLAEELSTPVMVCMDGFILTHAVERVDIPDAGAGRRVPAAVSCHARCSTPDEPVSIGAMVGPEAFMEVKYLAHAKQMQALELIPEIAADFSGEFGPGLRRSDPRLPRRGRRDDRRRARLGARDDQGHGRRAARAGCEDRCRWDHLVPSVPAGRGARSARPAPSAWSCSRRRSPSASAGSSRRTSAWRSPASSCTATRSSRASAGGRSRRPRCAGCSPTRAADRLEPLTFLDMDWDVVNRELERMGASRASGPHAENILRDVGPVAAGPV